MDTEEEARRKWCPFVRFHRGTDDSVYHNKPPSGECDFGEASMSSTHCIASQCMAWRWCTEENEDAQQHYDAVGGSELGPPPAIKGYCGLAGNGGQ